MANKREFKKSLEALSSALVSEMMASMYNVKEADSKKIGDAITTLTGAMLQAKKEAGKMFDKGVKEFENLANYNAAKAKFTKEQYKNAIAKYNDALKEALQAYNEAMPKNKPEA